MRAVKTPTSSVTVSSPDRVAATSSTTFEVIRRFHRAIAIITLTASGVFLACIMTLKVPERRTQVSALRLVGVSHSTLFGWLLAEATIISVLGGLLGLGIGQLASSLINAWYQRVYDTQLLFSLVTPETLALGLGLAVVLGIGAGAVEWRLARRTFVSWRTAWP